MGEPPAVAPRAFDPPYLAPGAAAPRFAPGAVVRVKRGAAPGHMRTPWYLRGRTGRVERVCGHFANPEELAYRRDGEPVLPLYRVRFALADLWGDGDGDTIDAEIFEHWLEPGDAP
ncbi:MAG: nitrile hydratase subunit beta [Rhodobacteraceae bacterium]|nr:MAG: nitrile hydratase subunit beta [Paracoccaceae bacterium]